MAIDAKGAAIIAKKYFKETKTTVILYSKQVVSGKIMIYG